MSENSHGSSRSRSRQEIPNAKSKEKLSETSASSPVIVPTPSTASEPERLSFGGDSIMDATSDKSDSQPDTSKGNEQGNQPKTASPVAEEVKSESKSKPSKNRSVTKKKTKRKEKRASSSSSESTVSDSGSDSEDSSEDEEVKSKSRRKLAGKKADKKTNKKEKTRAEHKPRTGSKSKSKSKSQSSRQTAKSKEHEDSSDEDDSSTETSDSEVDRRRRTRARAQKSSRRKTGKRESKKEETSSEESSSTNASTSVSASETSSLSDEDSDSDHKVRRRVKEKAKRKGQSKKKTKSYSSSSESSSSEQGKISVPADVKFEPILPTDDAQTQMNKLLALQVSLQSHQASEKADSPEKKNALEFKRVDQVYDSKIRDWKLVESNKEQKDEFDCVFTVRRRLDWDGKYKDTKVDIKSKLLRDALQEVFKDCKSISLVEDTPQIDPHTLFHYYDELKIYISKTLKPKYKKTKRSKVKKQTSQQIAQCKLLLSYIDEDYDATRKALKPMLKAGTITYDLVWALFKPNTIIYTPTYGNKEDPRCFKADFTYEYESWMTGKKSWVVDGRYLEYDGKTFGLGDHQVMIPSFKGHKKITSLEAYPLKYHRDAKALKLQLVERGKKFVALQGMNYRLQKGIAYMKHKANIIKFVVNGRVMVDPAIFRRMNPNYPFSYLRQEEMDAGDDESDGESTCNSDDCEGDGGSEEKDKLRTILWKDSKGKKHPIQVLQSEIDKENQAATQSSCDEESKEAKRLVFTEEELLIASPVVLGFAFSEKLWLEFSLGGIEDIKWNQEAFESLVLPDRIKQNLKGLVSSHRFNAAKTIDDVIKGKGKGLNIVLHGPPGVGKTLTGESIAEYLKCPLYAVSAGELGTNSRSLEQDLNRIMDITHSWGAILLLDEADVFLEARQPHDIHRNSLVSVFLRLTEYYQGILFLTTNRVESFDEAFQSRIHMGIQYENLTVKARKKIWMHHIGKVEQMSREANQASKKSGKPGLPQPFSEADYDELSKKVMNGRQIKNTVKTSQSIALAEKAHFSMEYVKRVMEVAEAFEDDMRGGKGYRDAMRQYT